MFVRWSVFVYRQKFVLYDGAVRIMHVQSKCNIEQHNEDTDGEYQLYLGDNYVTHFKIIYLSI